MKGYGGFEHNLQSLRVVDYLESRYADFDGLNLTYETREGILKHCSKKNAIHLGELGKRFINNTSPSLEAQIVNLADEIAYCHHDLDDGFRSQIIDFEQLQDLALFSATAQAVKKKYKHIEPEKLMHESIRRMMYGIINDVCQTSLKKIEEIKPNSINAVRAHQIIITFSPSILDAMMKLKNFSRQYIYRHPKIEQMTLTAKQTIERLFYK
jgi:dGTPase